MDNEHKNAWVDRFRSSRTLEVLSDLVSIQYNAFALPFPFADRDFVYRYEVAANPTLNQVTVRVESIEHPAAPAGASIGVRGWVKARYTLEPISPERTFCKAQYLADPKGLLPAWLTNLVQRSWPYETAKSLKAQVSRDYVETWLPYDRLIRPQLKFGPHNRSIEP